MSKRIIAILAALIALIGYSLALVLVLGPGSGQPVEPLPAVMVQISADETTGGATTQVVNNAPGEVVSAPTLEPSPSPTRRPNRNDDGEGHRPVDAPAAEPAPGRSQRSSNNRRS
ncbi:MAG: hypothetical protein FWG25_01705 [Promicromonosporaceae bacterium]|nr:hypothetical protein [Promicromonosporaceae bacterium]